MRLIDRVQHLRHRSRLRLRTLRAPVAEADAHRAGFHVATADDQHHVDAQMFHVGNLGIERRRGGAATEIQKRVVVLLAPK